MHDFRLWLLCHLTSSGSVSVQSITVELRDCTKTARRSSFPEGPLRPQSLVFSVPRPLLVLCLVHPLLEPALHLCHWRPLHTRPKLHTGPVRWLKLSTPVIVWLNQVNVWCPLVVLQETLPGPHLKFSYDPYQCLCRNIYHWLFFSLFFHRYIYRKWCMSRSFNGLDQWGVAWMQHQTDHICLLTISDALQLSEGQEQSVSKLT